MGFISTSKQTNQFQGCELTRQLVECKSQMVRRVVLGGGVPLVGPQEELRGLSGYSARGLSPLRFK